MLSTPHHHTRARRRLPVATVIGGMLASLALAACDSSLPPASKPDAEPAPQAPSFARSAQAVSASMAPTAGFSAQCPPMYFTTGINLAANPSFETGPGPKTWPPGPYPVPSAATGWYMHSSNDSAKVYSSLVQTDAPGPSGHRMLYFRAGGNEGGVYQIIQNAGSRVMFSAWVKVISGQVVLGANAMVDQTPYSWSTKHGEWEQLRVCTDGSYQNTYFFILNEAARGGVFYVDRVEVKQIP